jgi:hypothetical protein
MVHEPKAIFKPLTNSQKDRGSARERITHKIFFLAENSGLILVKLDTLSFKGLSLFYTKTTCHSDPPFTPLLQGKAGGASCAPPIGL